jgi:voltage-gated potassium channel
MKEASSTLRQERNELLSRLEAWLEMPMLILGFVWLLLLIVEFVWGLSPLLAALGTVIWVLFIFDFAVKFALAPDKTTYLKTNWLTAVSLLAPALRILRIARLARLLRAARAARGLRLLRVISSLNRGMRVLGVTFARRGFGYVIMLTLLVTLGGAAGMYAFENSGPDQSGLNSYGAALWWTAMLMTTMGSEYWPRTVEGRILCFFLALYAFGVFGYVTATLATFFIGRDAESQEPPSVATQSIEALRREVAALREELQISRPAADT